MSNKQIVCVSPRSSASSLARPQSARPFARLPTRSCTCLLVDNMFEMKTEEGFLGFQIWATQL